jgi:hypothetical protein
MPLAPHSMTPVAVAAMERAGTPPEIVHAFVCTEGLLITESDRHLWSAEELAEWDAAIADYFSGKDSA